MLQDGGDAEVAEAATAAADNPEGSESAASVSSSARSDDTMDLIDGRARSRNARFPVSEACLRTLTLVSGRLRATWPMETTV